jgi:hypothetical protein
VFTSGAWRQEPLIVPKVHGLNFSLAVCGNYVGLEFYDGSTWGVHFEKYGGHFTPRIEMKHGNSQTVKFNPPSYGVARPHMPVITDLEAYGESDSSFPYRGGGFNHLSSYGWNRVVRPVIEAARWRA